MKVTYKDGTDEEFENAEEFEVGDSFVEFQDKDEETIANVSIDCIKKIE